MKKALVSAMMIFALVSIVVPISGFTSGGSITTFSPSNHGWN